MIAFQWQTSGNGAPNGRYSGLTDALISGLTNVSHFLDASLKAEKLDRTRYRENQSTTQPGKKWLLHHIPDSNQRFLVPMYVA